MGYDIDAAVLKIYDAADCDPTDPEGPLFLAERIFGLYSLRPCRYEELKGRKSALVKELNMFAHRPVRGRLPFDPTWCIKYWHKLPAPELVHKVGHELLEWQAKRDHCTDPDIENICDQGGAAVAMPRAALRWLIAELETADPGLLERGGPDGPSPALIEILAKRFNVTQQCALMRWGEWQGTPVLIRRGNHGSREWVRGDEWRWEPFMQAKWWAWACVTPNLYKGLARLALGDHRNALWITDRARFAGAALAESPRSNPPSEP